MLRFYFFCISVNVSNNYSILCIFFQSPKQGADPVVYVAVSPKAERQKSLFFGNSKPMSVPSEVTNKDIQKRLWNLSCNLTGLEVLDSEPSSDIKNIKSKGAKNVESSDMISSKGVGKIIQVESVKNEQDTEDSMRDLMNDVEKHGGQIKVTKKTKVFETKNKPAVVTEKYTHIGDHSILNYTHSPSKNVPK